PAWQSRRLSSAHASHRPTPLIPRLPLDLLLSPPPTRPAPARQLRPGLVQSSLPRRPAREFRVPALALPERRRCDVVLDRKSTRSEEHTSELQSRENLVCRLLLEK